MRTPDSFNALIASAILSGGCMEYGLNQVDTDLGTDNPNLETSDDTGESDEPTSETPDNIVLPISSVVGSCNQLLSSAYGQCPINAETLDYDSDCVATVDQQGAQIEDAYLEAVSNYFHSNLTLSDIDGLDWTVMAYNSRDLEYDEDGNPYFYAATMAIAPGHHESLFSEDGFVPVSTSDTNPDLPILFCGSTGANGGITVLNGYPDFQGLPEANVHSSEGQFAYVNSQAYDCDSGDYSCAPTYNASQKIADEYYDLTSALLADTPDERFGIIHF